MSDDSATPMMAQYLEIRAQNPGALLFYRMGDFYEMFFDDAVAASAALDIALTQRGTHLGTPIPMCGVPVHAAESYLLTLIRKGFRVAVAEQLEDPAEARKRGAKAVVRRDVVRLVTPGTLTEDALLDARRHNYLAAFVEVRDAAALAWTDISTGALHVMDCPLPRLAPELARLAPRELLVTADRAGDLAEIATDLGTAVTPVPAESLDSRAAERRLARQFAVASPEAFGLTGRAAIAALGGILAYLDVTQRGSLPLLLPPKVETTGGVVDIDPATRRSLELTSAQAGGRDGSLLQAIDRTLTAAGGRLLERRISAPSCSLADIHRRQADVTHLRSESRFCGALRTQLRLVPDIERALSRLALDRGGPRDLAAIRDGLSAAEALAAMLAPASGLLDGAAAALTGQAALIALLTRAIAEAPPLLVRDGGFIAEGYDGELDETRALRDESRAVIAGLQAEYAAEAGVTGLKIRHNNVLGYFVEVTATHEDRLRQRPELFIHRQTTAGQVRFTTLRLSELESRILNAANHAIDLEKRHYDSLKSVVLAASPAIRDAAKALAETDVATALADLARDLDWCAPVIDDSRAFLVEAGRHPVVEAAQARAGTAFIANSCDLTASGTPAIWLVTGPNMAGKSTFLRQNALIALLAQAGSHVPAKAAHIGLVSQIFSRVGASDDLARGRSTFMVEMVETAAILNRADDRAFVILDEIGRGTATWDGLSIAWATLEHLHDVNRCRALFATHYHELAALAGRLPGVENANVAVKEWDSEVIFLHEVVRGAADRSYGVQVARLAGLPAAVVGRAREVLARLEAGDRDGARSAPLLDDLPLFRATPAPMPAAPPKGPSAVEARLREVLPDSLTPLEALRLVYELKDLSRPT